MAPFWSGGRCVAATALLVALPPILSSAGRGQALKVSLAALLYYAAKAAASLASAAYLAPPDRLRAAGCRPLAVLQRTLAAVSLGDAPLLLAAAYGALLWMPHAWTAAYQVFLIHAYPLLVLLEGCSALTVILGAGRLFSRPAGGPLRLLGLLLCTTSYASSAGVVAHMYEGGLIATLAGSTLAAITFTLTAILAAVAAFVPHASCTDGALLFLYVTYNVWTLGRGGALALPGGGGGSMRSLLLGSDAQRIAGGALGGTIGSALAALGGRVSAALGAGGAPAAALCGGGERASPPHAPALADLIGGAVALFGVEIVATLLVQMALFICMARMYRRAAPTLLDVVVSTVWPSLGRAVLVALYTYAGLLYTRSIEGLPLALDPVTWRWVNILASLAIYTAHLAVPPPAPRA